MTTIKPTFFSRRGRPFGGGSHVVGSYPGPMGNVNVYAEPAPCPMSHMHRAGSHNHFWGVPDY